MHKTFLQHSHRHIGSVAVQLCIALSFIVVGSSASASPAQRFADDVINAGLVSTAGVSKVIDTPVSDKTQSLQSQCVDGSWRGTPLVARYRITNYSVAKRFVSTPPGIDQMSSDAAVSDKPLQTSLHQLVMADDLLSSLPVDASTTSEFVLWREGDIQQRAAHEHPKPAITEVWNKPSDYLLRRSRHFDAHRRAIEFEPFNIKPSQKTNNSTRSGTGAVASGAQSAEGAPVPSATDVWLQKYYLAFQLPDATAPTLHPDGYLQLLKQGVASGADTSLLDALNNRQPCDELKVIHDLRERYTSEMVWDESIRLPVYMQTVRDNSAPLDFTQAENKRNNVGALSLISRWVLVGLETDQAIIKDRFAAWDSHETTDFADIGDNESDPFLMRMITLGFISHGASGFYDASGNMISSGTGHYHPPVPGAQ